jgi:hypothetical protein
MPAYFISNQNTVSPEAMITGTNQCRNWFYRQDLLLVMAFAKLLTIAVHAIYFAFAHYRMRSIFNCHKK